MTESAPTRRSSRPSPSPIAATPENAGVSRAERRRRDASAAAASSDSVISDAVISDAVILEVVEEVVLPEPAADEVPVRRTRRSTRDDRVAAPVVEPEIGPEQLTAAEPGPRRATLRAARPEVAPEPVIVVAAADESFELLEPVLVEPAGEAAEQPEPEASVVDDFEAAARLFSFTGETTIIPEVVADEPVVHAVPRRARRVSVKRVAAASFSVGVMGIVGLLTVGMTTPAEAVAAAAGSTAATVSVVAPGDVETDEAGEEEIQAYVAPASTENVDVARAENYTTISMAELARESGIVNFSNLFVNNPTSPIQWPFAVGVPMSYGFGMRSGSMHQGIDFTPGAGSPIQAIADGTVRVATSSGGAYGVHVIVDHIIDGQLVSSHYAHMQYGTIQVEVGQQVTVGTVLGRTGNTGRSYGAHTHFEILMNGTTPIDPLPWLREHAGG